MYLTKSGWRRHAYLANMATKSRKLSASEQDEMDVLNIGLNFNLDSNRERNLTANDGIDPRYNKYMHRLKTQGYIIW